MREAQVLQGAIDRVVRYRERILLVEPHDQIARPPANHTVDRRDRTLLYDPSEKGPVRMVELGQHARRRDVDETVRPLRVEPDHPVPQRLAIHPADLRRVFPRGPIEHSRNRQKPSRLRDILCALRKLANLADRIVRPYRNCLAHGKHPPFATLNHAARDSEIPGESAAPRVGISSSRDIEAKLFRAIISSQKNVDWACDWILRKSKHV